MWPSKYNLFICSLNFIFSINSHLAFAQKNIGFKETLQLTRQWNLSLKSEIQNINIAKAEIVKAGIRPNPIFNAQILMLTTNRYFPQSNLITSDFNRQDWYQLTKRIQLPGQRMLKIKVANKSRDRSGFVYEDYLRELNLRVANNWVEVWFAQVNKNLADEAVNSLYSYVENKLKMGNGKETLESIRLRILDDEYDMFYIKAEREYLKKLEALRFMAGLSDSLSIDFEDLFFADTIITSEEMLYKMALEYRPDIEEARIRTIAEGVNIKLQQALAFPTPEAGLIFNPQNTIPYFGLFFTQPIPIFDRNQADVQKAAITKNKSEIDYENIVLGIKSEVRIALNDYLIYRNNATRVARMLKDADYLVDEVRKNYQNKLGSSVDLWEAEKAWFETEKLFFQSEYEYRKSHVNLLYVTGLINRL